MLTIIPSQNALLERLTQKITRAIEDYHQNLIWLNEQEQEGAIDREKIMEIVISRPSRITIHISPVEEAIDKLYNDPVWAQTLKKQNTNTCDHIFHTAAKQLTLNQRQKSDYPDVCHSYQR